MEAKIEWSCGLSQEDMDALKKESLFKIEVAYLYSYKFTYSPTINGIPNTNENTHFPTKLQILI